MKELDWKILIVLYEKRSITKTAEALYLTQSAVTKRLQNMENEWGIEVIRRSSQGVSFTEDGTYLAQRASVMLDFLNGVTYSTDGEIKQVAQTTYIVTPRDVDVSEK